MAVDVQTFTDYADATRRAQAEALRELRKIFADELRSDPNAREKLLRDLEEIRAAFREAGQPDIEDVVLEVMDFVSGWCSPHMRI